MKDRAKPEVFVFYTDKITCKAVEKGGETKYFAEGYISTGKMDLVNDVVTKGCMDDMFQQFDDRVVKLDYEHEAMRGKDTLQMQIAKTKLPLAKAVDKFRDEKGLGVTWEFNPAWKKFDEKGNVTMTFQDLWGSIKKGFLDAFSIAYVPMSTKSESVQGKDVRLLDRVNLLNVALTGNPINPGATMTAVMAKSLEFINQKEGKRVADKKSYDEDGNHIHNDENPMGIHTHKEIEVAINKLWDRIYDLESGVAEDSTGLKAVKKKGENMPDEEKKPDAPAEEPAKEPEKKPDDAPADEGKEPEKPADAPEGEKPEGEEKGVNKDLVEVKAQIAKLSADLKAKDKELSELKAVVEKARIGSKGPENKADIKEITTPIGQGFTGPVDLIH